MPYFTKFVVIMSFIRGNTELQKYYRNRGKIGFVLETAQGFPTAIFLAYLEERKKYLSRKT
jgi:hypothetical protein